MPGGGGGEGGSSLSRDAWRRILCGHGSLFVGHGICRLSVIEDDELRALGSRVRKTAGALRFVLLGLTLAGHRRCGEEALPLRGAASAPFCKELGLVGLSCSMSRLMSLVLGRYWGFGGNLEGMDMLALEATH